MTSAFWSSNSHCFTRATLHEQSGVYLVANSLDPEIGYFNEGEEMIFRSDGASLGISVRMIESKRQLAKEWL